MPPKKIVPVELFPAAKIEITDAEIRSRRDLERPLKSRQQVLFDVVEDATRTAREANNKIR